jgi:hypothetical protein
MKVGTKYEYPDWRLHPTLIDTLKKIYGKFGLNQITDQKMLAVFLGHTQVTGGFLSKKAAMRVYGLITGRGYVQVSELGKRIAQPEKSDDPYEATKESIISIPLWKVLYEKYTGKGVELPDLDFWVDLREIAELVPDDAKKLSKMVRNDYLLDIQYLNSLKEARIEGKKVKDESKVNTSDATLHPVIHEGNVDDGTLVSGLVRAGAYKVAKDFIDFIEKKNKENASLSATTDAGKDS